MTTWNKQSLVMKNLYKYGMLAVAALAFASCNKEVDTKDVTGTHVVTVRASKDFDTRTAIVEGNDQATYVWTEGDVEYFHIYENGQEAISKSMTVDEDGLATFTVSFNNTTATSFEYTAKFFKEESNSHNPLIIADQKPSLTSYDPTADVLIAKPELREEPATELQFALRRVATINKMLLKGLESGEKINTVELASTDKNFSAYFVAASTVTGDDGSVSEKPESYSSAGKKLTLDYSELANATVSSDGTFAVFFVSAPVEEATFSVKVTTDQNVYERTLSSKLTLAVGQVKRFGIQLGEYGTPISAGTVYTLVESVDDLSDGATYIIVANKEVDGVAKYYALGVQASNNRSGATIPAPSNKTITIDNSYAPYPVKLTAVGQNWYIIDNLSTSANFGQYIYNASTTGDKAKSYLRSEATPDSNNKAEWAIAIAEGVASVNNVGNTDRGCLALNYNNGSPLFNVYASIGSYSPLALYVDLTTVSSKETATITFDNPTTTVNIGEYVTNVATIEPSSLSFVYSSEDINIATVDGTGKVKGVAAGTTTIKATFAGNEEYKSAIASYEITVVDPNANDGSAEKPYTASEAVDIASASGFTDRDNVYVKGIVCTTGSISSGAVNYYLSDDGTTTKKFEAYKGKYISGADFTDETNLKLGDYVVACGTLTYYSSSSQAEFKQGSQVISVLRAPTFSPTEGNFSTETLSVTITADSDAQIRYTTDGTDPTATTGTVYSSAISINASTTIKAIAVKDGVATGVVSKAYTKVSGGSTTATFVFNTDAGISALGITKPAASAGTDLEGSYSVDGVTMSVTHGSTNTRVWNSNGTLDLRIYKSGSLSFSVPSGKNIKKIEMAGSAVNVFSASTGSFSNGTWTGSANSVTLTATGTGKINTIAVTYE